MSPHPVVVKQRRQPPASLIHIGAREGTIYRWPGSGGTDLTVVDTLTSLASGTQVMGPLVYNPGDGLIYAFMGNQSSGNISIHSVNPTSGSHSLVASFNFLASGPYKLGGAPSNYTGGATPTSPFTYDAFNIDGNFYSVAHFPMIVQAATLIDGYIYLSCHDYSTNPDFPSGTSPTRSIFNVMLLARFDPVAVTVDLCHGPFQIGQLRTWMAAYSNPSSRPDTPDVSPWHWWSNWGYSGDNNAPGFIAKVGSTLYWSAGAVIFTSADGSPSSWGQVYDGFDETNLIMNHQVYALHYPGAFDASGNYLFGATGEKTVVVTGTGGVAAPTNGTNIQQQPYSVADTDGTDSTDSVDGFPLPIGGVGAQEGTGPTPGVALAFQNEQIVTANAINNPVSRAVFQIDTAGVISKLYEDSDESSDVGRAWMGRVMPLYGGRWTYSDLVALSGGNIAGSTRDDVTLAYVASGGSWTPDAPANAPFTLSGKAQTRALFTYKGQVYAISTHYTTGPSVQLLKRTGSGTWVTVAASFGTAWNSHYYHGQALNIPQYSFLSTALGGSL